MAGPVWFFDLDNTLHDASWRIFGALDVGINGFMQRRLQLTPDEANRMRLDFWTRYGATLAGLSRHYGIGMKEYLEETHNFIEQGAISEWTRIEHRLARSLAMLPGRKVLLTNAPSRYAHHITTGLGIAHLFDRTIAIDDMRRHGPIRPKPSRFLLQCLMAEESIVPSHAILVEDTLANLKSARAVGWRTVHVSGFAAKSLRSRISRPSYVDLQVKSIAQLVRRHRLVCPDAKR
jgi:putative hydrolase of the HAD superfamily